VVGELAIVVAIRSGWIGVGRENFLLRLGTQGLKKMLFFDFSHREF
jgi:hypothetical protein